MLSKLHEQMHVYHFTSGLAVSQKRRWRYLISEVLIVILRKHGGRRTHIRTLAEALTVSRITVAHCTLCKSMGHKSCI